MTIKEAQATVDEWINTIGVRYYNELTNTAVLMEEVGEMARLMAADSVESLIFSIGGALDGRD